MGHGTRNTSTNDLPSASNENNPWSKGNEFYDAVCRLLNGMAHRCSVCKRITDQSYLTNGKCPDCKK